MNINRINKGELGYTVTVVTLNGNKIEGTIIGTNEDPDVLKIKTDKGIVVLNSTAIESIY